MMWTFQLLFCLQIVKYNPEPRLLLSQFLREECIIFILCNSVSDNDSNVSNYENKKNVSFSFCVIQLMLMVQM